MANINKPFNFRPVKSVVPCEQGWTEENLTVQEGQPLVRNADGTIGLATASSTALLGYAAHDLAGETGTKKKLLFYPAVRTMVLEARALPGATVNLSEAFGKPVGLSMDANGVYGVKLDATTTYCTLQTVGFGGNTTQDLSCATVRVITVKSSWPVDG